MKTKKILPLMLVLACILSSFSGDVKPFTNGDKWIPADFDAKKGTLLVETFYIKGNQNAKRVCDKVTADMKQEMKANYPYKYEFVAATDIANNPKYADKDVYKYVLMNTNTTIGNLHEQITGTGGVGGMRVSSNDFHFYDRKIDKSYPVTGKPSSSLMTTFKPVIATIVKFAKEHK